MRSHIESSIGPRAATAAVCTLARLHEARSNVNTYTPTHLHTYTPTHLHTYPHSPLRLPAGVGGAGVDEHASTDGLPAEEHTESHLVASREG